MKTVLSAAIIGAGNIAGGFDEKRRSGEKGVYTHAGAFRAVKNIRLRTVFDADLKRAATFAKAWGGSIRVAADLNEVLKGRHDIVSVCTPDNTHFRIVKALIQNKSCKTIFVEKPAATTSRQLRELIRLSKTNGVHVIVNFQRHFDLEHIKLARLLKRAPRNILSAQGIYIKGLAHIGVTMLDTLRFFFGNPRAVLSLRRVFNRQIGEYSYDFTLFYSDFSVSVKTADSPNWSYTYHVFEVDILLKDRRIRVVDNSRSILESGICSYSYSGVKVLNDISPEVRPTGYRASMVDSVRYLYEITADGSKPAENTLRPSLLNMLVVEAVERSYAIGLKKIYLTEDIWKK